MESYRTNIIADWFFWQFYETPAFLLKVWKNYLHFAENYFSVVFLVKTLFSPWRRYNWVYPKGFDLYGFFLALTSNVFSRFLGCLLRIVLIVMGICFELLVFVVGLAAVLLWILLPAATLGGIAFLFLY